jgi:hypothetical protein
MEQVQTMLCALEECVLQARAYRNTFDAFWKAEPSKRVSAHLAYFIRHGAMLNAFDNLLFLFCSREIWSAGGAGAWACTNNSPAGPILVHSNADQIEKLLLLFSDHREAVQRILDLHQHPMEQALLDIELKHIRDTLHLFNRTLIDYNLLID